MLVFFKYKPRYLLWLAQQGWGVGSSTNRVALDFAIMKQKMRSSSSSGMAVLAVINQPYSHTIETKS
jgi:hypothetical protein